MLSRLNSGTEVSLLPTGLGNHYTSSSKNLIPPGRRRFPYNHSVSSSSDCYVGDPNAPEANMSFREQQEYFGPDVLVIIGLVLACLGAILTLISFYCQFKHPAIQATMAGIGPSLVGIGMLFCVLRLFFCTFFISRTCCECIADGLRFLILHCPCCKYFRKTRKKVHPLRVKDIKPLVNGAMAAKALNNRNGISQQPHTNNLRPSHPGVSQSAIEMLPHRMEPIHESEEQQKSHGYDEQLQQHTSDPEHPPNGRLKEDEDILKDEIDLLEEMKTGSPNSDKSLHKNINELVLKSQIRY